ncbi:MAG: hypothetical protein E7261_10065 [Lachnospiraceae bacterium]|nr:hypothetical protein [Lachnospiraceae bacterium]
MLKAETSRQFLNKGIICFIIFAVLINFLQIYYLNKKNLSDNSIEGYRDVWESAEEKYALDGTYAVTEWLSGQQEASENSKVYRYVLEEYETIMGYDAYLKELRDNASKMLGASIFVKKDSFSYRNIESMIESYREMEGVKSSPSPSLGVESATSSAVTDLIALVVIIYICVHFWLRDREGGTMLLIRTTPVGRTALVWYKLFLLTIVVFVLNLLLNGGNLLGSELVYGLGDLDRELISVIEYRRTVFKLSVKEYLLLFMVCKYLAYMAVALLVSAIFCSSKTTLTGFVGVVGTVLVSVILYYFIAASSVWQALKYINPCGLMRTEDYLGDYINISVFKQPVELCVCMVVFFVILAIVCTILIARKFVELKKNLMIPDFIKFIIRCHIKLTNSLVKHVGVLLHEVQKILFTYGVFIVLVLYTALQIWQSSTVKRGFIDDARAYYASYMTELEGEYTYEKEEYVRGMLANAEDSYEKKGIQMVLEKMEYLKQSGGYILYEGGWNELTAAYTDRENLTETIYLTIAMILTLSFVFSADRQYGMYKLVTTTKNGQQRLQVYRVIVGFVIAMFVFAVTYCFKWHQIWEKNFLTDKMLSYPACSLENLSNFAADVTLKEYMIMLVAVRFVAVISGCGVIYYISEKIGTLSGTYIAMIALLVVPAAMVVSEKSLTVLYYPWSLFAGNMALGCPAWKVLLLVGVYLIIMVLCSYSVCRKKRV